MKFTEENQNAKGFVCTQHFILSSFTIRLSVIPGSKDVFIFSHNFFFFFIPLFSIFMKTTYMHNATNQQLYSSTAKYIS